MSRRQEGETTTVPLMCKQAAGNRGREWVCSARFCEQSDEALFKGWESGQADGGLLTVRREPEGRKHHFTFKETLRDLNQPCPYNKPQHHRSFLRQIAPTISQPFV